MSYATQYAQVKAYAPQGMRGILRHVALDGLALLKSAGSRTDKALQLPRVQFLYIHHTFSDELEGLRLLIKDLAQHHSFISHSEGVERVLSGTIDRPYIAFSSDDGFKNNLLGARVLSEYGIKACFFINPGLIGLREVDRIRTICSERFHFPPVEFLRWNEVEELQQLGHEIGSHTMEHRNMGKLEASTVREDLQQSKAILEQHCGPITHFAYPYGRFTDITAQGFRDVFAAGYGSCASAERGCHIASPGWKPEELCVRRDHILLDWPLAHVRYFLAMNALKASTENNHYPG